MAVAAAPAARGDGATGSTEAPADDGQTAHLTRLHLLPISNDAEERSDTTDRLGRIAPELRRRRAAGDVLKGGDILRHDGLEFAVIKCEPEEGSLGAETDYFLDGNPVTVLQKIQFSAWGPEERSSEDLFREVVAPYMRSDFGSYRAERSARARLFHTMQTFKIDDIHFVVEATEPAGIGVVTSQTEIFANWDKTPEFDKVHILPFQDTLPSVYEYDIFEDYLRPYLECNKHKKFQLNELFMYHGVQFKMVACEPSAVARIGRQTTIYCEGNLHPSLRNLLPPELLDQVSQLPVGLQMLLLNTERTARELEDVLTHRRGLFPETLAQIEAFQWPPADAQASTQSTCMICLGEFTACDACRRLPCRHIFHASCVEEWLRRCTDCPICKDNVDRAIRNY